MFIVYSMYRFTLGIEPPSHM